MKKIRSLKNNRWRKVEVHWIDSFSNDKTGWFHPEEFIDTWHNRDLDLFVTVGFAFDQDDDYLYLAMSAHFEDNKIVAFCNVFKIPVGCIGDVFYSCMGDADTKALAIARERIKELEGEKK